jgi:RNA polymerase sigma-70 factor (ECF subfamily)
LGSQDEAEDVVQEAFVRLLGEAEPRDPAAWLFSVTHRLASNRRRSAKRHKRLALHPSLAPENAIQAAADEDIERAEAIAEVRGVLAMLSTRDQKLLLLHHDGWRYREIAEQLAIAPSSVGSLLTRAHRRLLTQYRLRHNISAETGSNG